MKTVIIFILFIILFIIINRNIHEKFQDNKIKPYMLANQDVLDTSIKVSDKFKDDQDGIERLAKKMDFKYLFESIENDPIEFKNNVKIDKRLDVRGDINSEGAFILRDNDNNDGMIKIKNDDGIHSQNCGIEIVGGSKQKKKYIDFNKSGINRGKILYEGNDSLNFFTGGEAGMIIDQSGKGKIRGRLGIGTNNPQSKVHINGNNSEIKFIGQSGHGTKNTISFNDNESDIPLSKIEADDLYHSTHIDLYTKTQNNNLDSRLHIHNDGNIGIGNKNPTSKLDVSGRITTDEICIGDICINEDTLKKLKKIQENIEICPDIRLVATEHQANANNASCNGEVFYGKAFTNKLGGNRLSFDDMKSYNRYAKKNVNGNFNCNNSYFGDPHIGHIKQCYCKSNI